MNQMTNPPDYEALLKARKFQEVIDDLNAKNGLNAQEESYLGLAHFHCQDYERAEQYFQNAVDQDPKNKDWQALLSLSQRNATGKLQQFVPEIVHFNKEELLQAPPKPELPTPPPPLQLPYQLHKLRYLRPFIGRTVGRIGSGTFNTATRLLGKDYMGRIWTAWYKRPWLHGIFNLAYMRDLMNEKNLKSTYPSGSKIAFQDSNLQPPPGVQNYRTADGTWNNLDNPKEGAAHTRFMRNVTDDKIRPESIDDTLLEPNPREVSRKLLTRGKKMQEVPFLNMLAASWIQFQNHDWISHGENFLDEIIEVPLPEDDPAREKYKTESMQIARTQNDPSYGAKGAEKAPVTFVNEVTHWWDGSQIYGSDQATQDRLRSGVDGRLKLDAEGYLPLHEKLGTEDTGFVRNWWAGLGMLHNLFAREHNAICDHLKYHYPDWNDDQLFNVARLVNAAVMAKIHTVEWTPAVLPNDRLNTALNSNWYGLLTYKFGNPEKRKTVATFNIQNPELGGLVGNTIDKHGCPFGLTEEFVEVYRLHSLLPEVLTFRNHEDGKIMEEVPFVASRQSASPGLSKRIGMANMFYSFGNQHPGNLGLNNYPAFMQEMSVPGIPFLDLAAVDILRARERGVPRYNEFRRQLQLKEIKSFDDLTDNQEHRDALREVYGDDVEKLDLLVGTLAEGHRPSGFGFGETLFQIFILNASRRLQADRFFTTDFNEDTYTREGMKWIDRASMKNVILRHFPELETTGLGNITNAFEPWDTEELLYPERHPLRQYVPELKKYPMKGDAY